MECLCELDKSNFSKVLQAKTLLEWTQGKRKEPNLKAMHMLL